MKKNLIYLSLLVLLGLSVQSFAQAINVSGHVTAQSDGTALPGVTILEKGSSKGTTTNSEGNYTLETTEGKTLTFSFIGLKTIEFPVPANGKLDVSLQSEETILNEVVITALGIAREKKSLGYAVQELKSAELNQARETNLVNALSGKIAGVNITNSQGGLGSSRIVIRGETSIAGNNQPLFIVDGIPVDNTQLGSVGANGTTGLGRDFANAIADINPDDIESINVLKGPNAAALYGSRASGGAVVIKTKTGKLNKKTGVGVALNLSYTQESALVLPKFQNSYGQGTGGQFSYVDGKGGGLNDGTDESWGPALDGRLIPQFFSKGVAVPWVAHPDNVKDFYEKGHTGNIGVSVTGADEKFDYRFSYNNSKQTGILHNTDLGKNSFSVNATYRLNSKLTLGTVANFIRTASDNLPGATGTRAISVPLQFIWFGRQVDTGLLKNYKNESEFDYNWNHSYYSNMYRVLDENTVQQRRDRTFGNIHLDYQITDWLSATVRTGNDYYNDKRKYRISYGTNGTPFGSYTEDSYVVNENNTDFSLVFDKAISSDFNLNILGGGNLRNNFYEQNYQQAPKLAVAGLYTINNTRDTPTSFNVSRKQKVYSLYSSAQVGFRNYAFLNLTARNDWSSTLPRQNNSYFYPSVNASVVLSEALNIQSNVLTFLKIRGGWAQVGKDTDPYQLVNTYPFNQPFGSSPLLTVSDIKLNPNLKPEITRSTEVGVDAAFFKNRVRIDLSYYNTNSFDQILSADISPSTGYKSQVLNAGHINNHGFEAQLNLTPVQTASGFKWNVLVNFSRNISKVVSLDDAGLLTNYRLGSNGVTQVVATKGERYGALIGTSYQRNANGEIIINDDGTIARNANLKTLGYFTPKWLGGITNSFGYKGFNLSVLIDTKQGGQIYSATNNTGRYTGVLASTLPGRDEANGGLAYYYPGNQKSQKAVQLASHGGASPSGETVYHDGIVTKGVTADGKPNATVISAETYYKNRYSNSLFSESGILDASFVKLREVRLSYAIPASIVHKLHLQGLTVALTGRNLAFLSKKAPNIDPESAFSTGNGQGLESLQLPSTRSYGVNLNVNF
jgi:TonB-linked SusC/RagA family outer membrane protein